MFPAFRPDAGSGKHFLYMGISGHVSGLKANTSE
jgi:hypothetical protein